MTDLLDWTEKAALENLRFHLQNADNLAKESNTTLTVLLAALGAVLAYTLRVDSAGTVNAINIGAGVLTAYLVALSTLLVYKCMRIAPIPAPTNEPRNLYQKNFKVEMLREIELNNMQERINQIVARNDALTTWLNRIRLFAVASPIVFLAGAFLAAHLLDLCGRVVAAV
jgi:hypothetical protein